MTIYIYDPYIINPPITLLSPPAMTIFTKTPPTFNYHHNFITSLRKTSRFSSRLLCTFKESSVHVFRKSVRFKEMNAAVSMETRFISSGQDEEHTTVSGFQQDALINNDDVVSVSHHQNTQTSTYGLNTVVNRLVGNRSCVHFLHLFPKLNLIMIDDEFIYFIVE